MVLRAAVGIDLGTSSSAVAVVGPDGRPRVVPDEGGRPIIPSVLHIGADGRVRVGHAAEAAGALDPANTFRGIKRLMGRSYREVVAAPGPQEGSGATEGAAGASTPGASGGIPGLRSYELAEGPGGRLELACPALGRGVTPTELSSLLLRHLVQRAAEHLEAQSGAGEGAPGVEASRSGVQVLDAVITVPADYGPRQRRAVLEAAEAAGLQRVTLLKEPIAAAMAYGFGSSEVPYEVLLVVDLGGGTLDIAVLEAFDGILEVLATSGDAALGGDDFTAAVADWLSSRQRGGSPSGSSSGHRDGASGGGGSAAAESRGPASAGARAALLAAAEGAKLALSAAAEAAREAARCSGAGGERGEGRGDREGVSVPVRLPACTTQGEGAGAGAGPGAEAEVAVEAAVEAVLSERTFAEVTRPLVRRLWGPLEAAAVASRTQLGGRLPPDMRAGTEQHQQHPQAAAGRSGDGHSTSTGNGTEPQAGSAAEGAGAAASDNWAGGGSLASAGSGWDLALAAEGPGRREGAEAWAFSVFPPEEGEAVGPSGRFVAPPRRLSGVVLVGGGTRLPAVRDFVEEVTGLQVRPGIDPETAVALGAALQAGLMVGAVGGGLEMSDGGYVSGRHGRAGGFQQAAGEAAAGREAAGQEQGQAQGRKEEVGGGKAKGGKGKGGARRKVVVAPVLKGQARARGQGGAGSSGESGSGSEDEGGLVWEP
ncbi:hypothetical protein HYH03_008377 [Edaphochlamys debaryana]|uniref:Uncharacterized protein n=1 Tax=Edaphochlamys debaryana TaxID=47281 RepID=A0A835Y0B3_9CHLO|nr:hypothetical protein HYH03_008377 [Edaphochlamys debaryana]|eukprot:KAG2493563.1 hypothetical protein HYH03_008377 [Edaphochlamys debaryana]